VSEERLSERLEALRLSLEHVESSQIASGVAVKTVLRTQVRGDIGISLFLMFL
jgi:hypothetical protein